MLDKLVRVEMGLTDPDDLSTTKNCFDLVVDGVIVGEYGDRESAETVAAVIRNAMDRHARGVDDEE